MRTLDCRGLVCPEPVIRTRAALADADPTALQVIVDNDAARGNVSRYATNHGCSVTVESRDGLHYLTITPGEAPAAAAGSAAVAGAPAETDSVACPLAADTPAVDGSVVLVTGAVLGHGDDVLGAKLMSSFFYALTEAERVPAVIFFLNGGVRLTTGDTPLMPHLTRLAERGTRIASCGTCLDFFGLKEQLVSGEVTNMYSIVEACQAATRVITV